MTTHSAGKQTIVIAFVAFIGLGLSSGLLGLAWPSMRGQFGLALDGVNSLYLVQTVGYTLASFMIGRMMARLGSGPTLLAGVALMALCLFGTAASPTWALINAFGGLFGLGSGMLDAGLNLYVATYHSAGQMNWLHASFGLGITFGPLVMTYVLGRQLGWQMGYAAVGAALLGVVALLAWTLRLWRNEGFQTAGKERVRRASFGQSLRLPALWFSMATFLAYVGLEIGLGQWAYTLMTDLWGMAPEVAGPWVSVYWGAFTGGRMLFGLFANRLPVGGVLRACTLAAVGAALLFWWNPVNAVGLTGLVILGLVQAPIFPLLMFATAGRLGAEQAENAISLQMGAVGIGTAILPGLLGTIGKTLGLPAMAASFVVMALLVFGLHELTRVGAKQKVEVVNP